MHIVVLCRSAVLCDTTELTPDFSVYKFKYAVKCVSFGAGEFHRKSFRPQAPNKPSQKATQQPAATTVTVSHSVRHSPSCYWPLYRLEES